jgi:hypothetical protein
MTYTEYMASDKRDLDPVVLSRVGKRLHWDRFFKMFVLPDTQELVTVEEFGAAFSHGSKQS